uniref:Alpha 1,4-glycosyltransferase domain-containing protein n=1 Tax=viral metagenome TaxID=1070528 RepID=A0A6C0LGH0_9ZZZZ
MLLFRNKLRPPPPPPNPRYKIYHEKHQKIARQLTEFRHKNRPFVLKTSYNSIIPLHIYTCWHSKELPPFMNENVEYLKQTNPEFTVHVYDEEMCRTFIQEHFDSSVVEAYDKLKPSSYKSDLWRFCILYIHGGIYMDIKYRCINNFKLIALTEKEHFVRDREEFGEGTYTALIVTLPKNEIMWQSIQKIVENVKSQYYGNNPLDPTGPGLLGSFFTQTEKKEMILHFECTNIEKYYDNIYYIMLNDTIILTYYKQYRDEQNQFQKYEPYGTLWDNKDIYFS